MKTCHKITKQCVWFVYNVYVGNFTRDLLNNCRNNFMGFQKGPLNIHLVYWNQCWKECNITKYCADNKLDWINICEYKPENVYMKCLEAFEMDYESGNMKQSNIKLKFKEKLMKRRASTFYSKSWHSNTGDYCPSWPSVIRRIQSNVFIRTLDKIVIWKKTDATWHSCAMREQYLRMWIINGQISNLFAIFLKNVVCFNLTLNRPFNKWDYFYVV